MIRNMVGPVGFEPTIAESESAALPLGDGPRFAICSIANCLRLMKILSNKLFSFSKTKCI